jgi:hypothetical protein
LGRDAGADRPGVPDALPIAPGAKDARASIALPAGFFNAETRRRNDAKENAMASCVSFTASKADYRLISKIAARAVRLAEAADIAVDFQEMQMDLLACHANGCRLDMQRLIDAPDGEFGHDVFGIRRFLDRQTGQLGGCFVPRFALPEAA